MSDSPSAVRIGLLGARGRMGEHVQQAISAGHISQARLAAAANRGDPLAPLLSCDVVIDISSPEAALKLIDAIEAAPGGALPALVIGSTGWTAEQRARLERAATRTPVLVASNFSTGVLALQEILRFAAPLLEKLGYGASIVEAHHVHKKDAPSGTAISLQKIIAPSSPASVPVKSVREGEIIGDHEITFQGPADHITLGHFAQDRSIFARGAVDAAVWLASKRAKPPGRVIGMDSFFSEKICSKPPTD